MPSRVACVRSCSTAPLRNVSHAQSITFRPCPINQCATFARFVLLPTPFTPMKTMLYTLPSDLARIASRRTSVCFFGVRMRTRASSTAPSTIPLMLLSAARFLPTRLVRILSHNLLAISSATFFPISRPFKVSRIGAISWSSSSVPPDANRIAWLSHPRCAVEDFFDETSASLSSSSSSIALATRLSETAGRPPADSVGGLEKSSASSSRSSLSPRTLDQLRACFPFFVAAVELFLASLTAAAPPFRFCVSLDTSNAPVVSCSSSDSSSSSTGVPESAAAPSDPADALDGAAGPLLAGVRLFWFVLSALFSLAFKIFSNVASNSAWYVHGCRCVLGSYMSSNATLTCSRRCDAYGTAMEGWCAHAKMSLSSLCVIH
mmetsp:Transcript_8976/g.24125  ORF Transcript_8976/g.24125 Transcript_8976/m.24125 type:complete len:376 (+) Transcript_8976:537-1664(+)